MAEQQTHQQSTPPGWSPQPGLDPKAQAAAARAYAKAQRPWYKKKRWWLGGVIVLVIIIAIAASSGGSSTSTSTNSATGKGSKPNGTGPSALPIQNGDWRLDSVRIKKDFGGDFAGSARITYTGDDQSGGDNIFTITVFKHGKDIATLDGSANTVLPGHTATVDLLSTDNYVRGPWKFDFQNDL